jgi:hypothetical protein
MSSNVISFLVLVLVLVLYSLRGLRRHVDKLIFGTLGNQIRSMDQI